MSGIGNEIGPVSSVSAIIALIREIKAHLETRLPGEPGVDEVLKGLAGTDLSPDKAVERQPQDPPPSAFLDVALRSVPKPELGPLAEAIEAANPHLHWRHGGTYERDAVGASYEDGHAFCDLVGPEVKRGVILAEDFRLGLFVLGPGIFYRDHNHPAPELYLTLTGPTGWRFGHGPWQDLPAGAVVWNEPGQIHATRIYDRPLLTVYSWTRSVLDKCHLHPADDWPEVERDLRRG